MMAGGIRRVDAALEFVVTRKDPSEYSVSNSQFLKNVCFRKTESIKRRTSRGLAWYNAAATRPSLETVKRINVLVKARAPADTPETVKFSQSPRDRKPNC